MKVRRKAFCEAEVDEQWSYVGKKPEQRWLWYAIDHATSTVLAYVFGRRKDEVFKQLKALLQPFNIIRYYADDWGAYERHLDITKRDDVITVEVNILAMGFHLVLLNRV